MSAIRIPATIGFLSFLFAAAALPAQTAPATSDSSGMSKVRIVRLSGVNGSVQMDRGFGQGFEAAIVNLPIVEHTTLRTQSGVAEVEFEDNSTLRLAPESEVEFPELDRSAAGPTVSAVRLVRGTAYVSLLKTPGNAFTLLFGQQKVPLEPASHVRLQMTPSGATLAVLDGNVHLDTAEGGIDVPKKRTIAFSLDTTTPVVTKNIASDSFDSWDKQSSDYHARVANLSYLGSSPYAYGSNELGYYGAFSDLGGCGMMWRPYFASAAWDPYANGAWAWYQGAGYSWVSPYPWGWMPYHYGSWSYCDGAGWGWAPGGAWNGINNMATTTVRSWGKLPGTRVLPHPPANPPGRGTAGLIPVNLGARVASGLSTNHTFVFRSDSAGLGIPREGLGNLEHFSRNAVQHGFASTPVYMTVTPAAPEGYRGHAGMNQSAGLAPVSIHRGSAPTQSSAGFSGASSFNTGTPAVPSPAPAAGGTFHGVSGGGAGGGGGGHPH